MVEEDKPMRARPTILDDCTSLRSWQWCLIARDTSRVIPLHGELSDETSKAVMAAKQGLVRLVGVHTGELKLGWRAGKLQRPCTRALTR